MVLRWFWSPPVSAEFIANSRLSVIYIVESNPTVRSDVAVALAGLPWPVYIYTTPWDFLAKLPQSQDGCVVANVRQVDMSITELLGRLDTKCYRLPLIVLSENIEIPDAVAAMRAGAHDLHQLPLVERVLRRQVQSAMENIGQKKFL